MPEHPLRISVWSGPRNVSTALMYAFAQRPDTRVVDEPLYGHYLRVTGIDHPGREEIMRAMECDGQRVIREILLGPADTSIVFFKNMAHHLVDLPLDFLFALQNVLLIRDPQEMLPSLAQNLPQPILRDTGLDMQVKLFDLLSKHGSPPPVLDARELLLDPESVLKMLCDRLGIPFFKSMLSWPAGPRPEDGIWAKYWYHNLHRSTGFQPYRPKTEPFPQHLEPLLEECRPLYEYLYRFAIKASQHP